MLKIKFVDKMGETYYGAYFTVDFDHLFPDRFSGAYNFHRNEICVCKQKDFIRTLVILVHELGHYILWKGLRIKKTDSHAKYDKLWIKILIPFKLHPTAKTIEKILEE